MFVRVRLLDAGGQPIKRPARVELRRRQGGGRRVVGIDEVEGGEVLLEIDRAAAYVFEAEVEGYSRAAKTAFVFGDERLVEIRMPINPETATPIFPATLPPRLTDILALDLEELDDLSRAGLLNVWAKCAATTIAAGTMGLDLLTSIFHAQRDRIYVELAPDVEQELRLAVRAGTFDEVTGSVGHDPPREGYELDTSFKERVSVGNVQFTIFRSAESDVVLGDVDVDEARGIPHVFDVLVHHAFDEDSHPFEIHEILRTEGVKLLYELRP